MKEIFDAIMMAGLGVYTIMLAIETNRLWDLLDRYEALHASIIADNDCWKNQANECLPTLTPDQWDEWHEMQKTFNNLNEVYRPGRPLPPQMQIGKPYREQADSAKRKQLLQLLEHEFKSPTLGRDDDDWKEFMIENNL